MNVTLFYVPKQISSCLLISNIVCVLSGSQRSLSMVLTERCSSASECFLDHVLECTITNGLLFDYAFHVVLAFLLLLPGRWLLPEKYSGIAFGMSKCAF